MPIRKSWHSLCKFSWNLQLAALCANLIPDFTHIGQWTWKVWTIITLCPHFHTTMGNPLNFVQTGQEKWKVCVEFIYVLKERMPITETFSQNQFLNNFCTKLIQWIACKSIKLFHHWCIGSPQMGEHSLCMSHSFFNFKKFLTMFWPA